MDPDDLAADLVANGRASAPLEAKLRERDCVVAFGPMDARVAFGVPHHAGPGIDRIADERPGGGRVADENAVLYALVAHATLAARGIASRVVVAAHPRDHDPNKDPQSPYCRALFEGRAPALLVECHGASWLTPHPLELSAGRNELADPLAFGARLARALGRREWLAAQEAPGDAAAFVLDADGAPLKPSRLKFPALQTASLQHAQRFGSAALHLEATPRFRTHRVEGLALTEDGAALGRALADAVAETL